MDFQGFYEEDFQVFHIDGLEERMKAIQNRIQPKFKIIGESLRQKVEILTGNEMFLHIAKHARRTVNPPNDTWLALCHDKRGYKKHPHFQVGLFDDHVFIWLAFIYELPNKKEIATKLLDQAETVMNIPNDFVISVDHTKKDALKVADLTKEDFTNLLTRFRDIKKVELLIGKHINANDPILRDGKAFIDLCEQTIEAVFPIYQLAIG